MISKTGQAPTKVRICLFVMIYAKIMPFFEKSLDLKAPLTFRLKYGGVKHNEKI